MSDIVARAAESGWVARPSPYADVGTPLGGAGGDLLEWAENLFKSRRQPPLLPPPPPEVNAEWPVDDGLPPLNQAPTNSCVAHAACATIELRLRRMGQPAMRLAPRFLHVCQAGMPPVNSLAKRHLRSALASGGAPVDRGGDALIRDEGMCPANGPAGHVAIASVDDIDGVEAMKHAIALRGPIVAYMELHDDFWNHYRDGVYRPTAAARPGRHAVAIQGYSDAGGYWICRNSLGPDWGTKGCFKIAYGVCGLGERLYTYEIQPAITPLR